MIVLMLMMACSALFSIKCIVFVSLHALHTIHSTLDIDHYRLYTLTVYIHLPGKAGVTLHVADILL